MLRLCWKYLSNVIFWAYLIASVFVGIISLATPFFTGMVINQLIAGDDMQVKRVGFLCLLLILMQVGQAALTYLSECSM